MHLFEQSKKRSLELKSRDGFFAVWSSKLENKQTIFILNFELVPN